MTDEAAVRLQPQLITFYILSIYLDSPPFICFSFVTVLRVRKDELSLFSFIAHLKNKKNIARYFFGLYGK